MRALSRSAQSATLQLNDPCKSAPLMARMSHVACRMSHVACCMSHVACGGDADGHADGARAALHDGARAAKLHDMTA